MLYPENFLFLWGYFLFSRKPSNIFYILCSFIYTILSYTTEKFLILIRRENYKDYTIFGIRSRRIIGVLIPYRLFRIIV